MAKQYFHFTLGPVQGFVAQARRTRDFWAGSFLLSWLSGVAMAEVERQQGKIVFPFAPAGYLDWIRHGSPDEKGPRQGAIPNRFKAEVPYGFDAALVANTVREAWLALAEYIWKQDLAGIDGSENARIIWDRQHGNFWEIAWVMTDDESASALLDQRKNWRSHYPEAEPGVKCMVMDGWQELSGLERPGRDGLSQFWSQVRVDKETDLREKEQLCALAYVKRRFVRHFADFSATLASGLTIAGWKLDVGMPSVSYMAAVHWLEALLETASDDEVRVLREKAQAVNASRDEWDTRIACLVNAADRKHAGSDKRQLLSLDGNLFFEHVHDNPQAYGYDRDKTRVLASELRAFRQNHPDFVAPLSPFYAVLLMDGDSLGSHMSDVGNQKKISAALECFTNGVPKLVESHNGYLIYAGGDDVLALLPLEDAMQCAMAIRSHYLSSFANTGIPTTISAAIEYAHVKMPLGKVLGDAHGLLDDVAKEGAGRDALAVRVWKPGGMALEWAQPWEVALQDKTMIIESIVSNFTGQVDVHGAQFSSKFFYRIRERFDFLNPKRKPDGSYEDVVLSEEQAISLLAVDYLNSGDNRDNISLKEAESRIRPLLKQCRPVFRNMEIKDRDQWMKDKCLKADGALLVRFLAHKGVER